MILFNLIIRDCFFFVPLYINDKCVLVWVGNRLHADSIHAFSPNDGHLCISLFNFAPN